MKKLLESLLVCAVLVTPALGVPDLSFNPETMGWFYDGGGTFTFSSDLTIRRVQGGTVDPLVGLFVRIPQLAVSGLPSGPYELSASTPFQIKDGSNNVLMSGTLHEGELIPLGAVGLAYPYIKADVTNLTFNNTIGSSLLTYWEANAAAGIDLNITIENNVDIRGILENGIADGDGLSGSMTLVPEPASICLFGLTAALGVVTRRKTSS
jgi:hypothetical protein